MSIDVSKFSRAREKENSRHWRYVGDIESAERKYIELIKQFTDYPLMPIDIDVFSNFASYGLDLGEELEKICKDRNWIYVSVVEHPRQAQYTIKVPQPGRMRQVVAPLLLLSTNDRTVAATRAAKSWTFVVNGPQRKEIVEKWIETCKEDALCQALLGFGPLYTRGTST